MLDNTSEQLIDQQRRERQFALSRSTVLVVILALELAMLIGVALGTGLLYHLVLIGNFVPVAQFFSLGLLVAGLFLALSNLRSSQRAEHERTSRRDVQQLVKAWTHTFLLIGVGVFLTKTGGDTSRGWLLLFYASGLVAVLGFEFLVGRAVRAMTDNGVVAPRRLLLVGTTSDMERYKRDCIPAGAGIEVVAETPLPEGDDWLSRGNAGPSSQLMPAVDIARQHDIDDVVILSSWILGPNAAKLAEPFLDLPVAVHFGQIGELVQFPTIRVSRIGATPTIVLRHQPLSAVQLIAKRAFDLAASAMAICALVPVFCLVAIAIKVDSPGPVFFRQRRRGFNQREFRIWKFRTMTTLDDGDVIKQAQPGDARITRIGGVLRRYNIDELPQLINVLAGEMSLVGPRPHAVAHDRRYERTIVRYRRRLNVKPGITGWAQIHGFRGPTESDDAMQQRVGLDLDYIEHWSITMDIYIIVMTVLSSRAYRNAL